MLGNRCIHSPGGHLFCSPRPETRHPPYNVGVMTEENTAPSFPFSCEPYLCAALTAGEKQSSKTTGSLGHRPEPNCPTRHAIPPPAQGRRFGSVGMGSNMILDNEPLGACASSCNRCKDSSSWQLTTGAFTGNGIKQMMCSHAGALRREFSKAPNSDTLSLLTSRTIGGTGLSVRLWR